MGQPELPDDLDLWPQDPFELLGVDRNADRRDVRAAYTRLIKRFKPERSPEAFRRIRAAYEALIASHRPEADGGNPQPADAEEAPSREGLKRLWSACCNGEAAEAHRSLSSALDETPDDHELRLRLYWLLYAFPELDEGRSADDLLFEGAAASGFRGPLWNICLQRIADGESVVDPDFRGPVDFPPANPDSLIDLARAKWRSSLRRLGICNDLALEVCSDCERLLALSSFGAHRDRARLLFSAGDLLAWIATEQGRALAAKCRREASLADVGDKEMERLSERFEFVAKAAHEWHVGSFPIDRIIESSCLFRALRLAPRLWFDDLESCRHDLLAALEPAASRPLKLLEDAFVEYDHHPCLSRLLTLAAERLNRGDDSEPAQDLVEYFAAFPLPTEPRVLLDHVWDFTLATGVSPLRTLAAVAETRSPAAATAERLVFLGGLRLAWALHSMFWNDPPATGGRPEP